MFSNITGEWPKHHRFILASCDETYFNDYFPRFYKTFKEHWAMPIHVHVIDPSDESLLKLESLDVTYTYCNTNIFDWQMAVDTFKDGKVFTQEDSTIRQWLYECYCQCQRFVVLGSNMQEQSVIVADVDAYALRKPSDDDLKMLFKATAFSTHNTRLMATFCHFSPLHKNIVEKVAKLITDTLSTKFVLGMDQIALKQMFRKTTNVTLLNDTNWIRHWDVKNSLDLKKHNSCLIYHEKGTRGKQKGLQTQWTDIGL
tara:strand:- start:860 stop:1627 length:768 start_codon:yes stop_codon:yes gene_type:complete